MPNIYAVPVPVDKYGTPMQTLPAPVRAVAQSGKENASVSSVITLGHNTTMVEMAATGGSALLKWVLTSDTTASVVGLEGTANYDHVIPQNTYRRFVVPIEGTGSWVTSVQGVNRGYGLIQRVAFKSNGTASVLLTEY